MKKNPAPQIVLGQKVSGTLQQRSRELRRNMTLAEKTLWEHLRANRLNGAHFRRQQVIDGRIVDFYCHRHGLVIELDGSVHDNRAEEDSIRDAKLSERGLNVIRFRNQDILDNLDSVLRRITEACS